MTKAPRKTKKRGRSLLFTKEQVAQMQKARDEGKYLKEIADEFKTSVSTVSLHTVRREKR